MNQKLEQFIENIRDKRIAIIGAGVSNIPIIQYFHELNMDITLFDKKNMDMMDKNVQDVIQSTNIPCYTGDNYLEHLEGFDYIFRSPSMLPTNHYLVKEKNRGCIITTEVEMVIKLAPCPVIGVTGSKGKTTTTTIIHHIIEALGYHTYLGGNIGIPLFTKIHEMKSTDIIVLELSSFQLMNMSVSPNVSIVTNISPDHLDVHKDIEEYIDAKKYIFKNQGKDDYLVLNIDDDIVKNFFKEAKGHVKYFGKGYREDSYYLEDKYIKYNGKNIIDTDKLMLKGSHNYINICAGLTAISSIIDLSDKNLEDIVKGIKGVHHRLEFVRSIDGVDWYNDSASTTPDKTLAGIYAFDRPIILIAGGYDKNISYEPLAKPIIEHVSKLILFGSTKDKIYEEVMKIKKETGSDLGIYVLDTLEEVVVVAKRLSNDGDVVLFSPASASFDMFKNAYQRGDKFKEIVNNL